MKWLTLWGLALATTLIAHPATTQKSISQMTQAEIHDEFVRICADKQVMSHIVNREIICEYSLDNWINWQPYIGWIATLVLVWALIRTRRRRWPFSSHTSQNVSRSTKKIADSRKLFKKKITDILDNFRTKKLTNIWAYDEKTGYLNEANNKILLWKYDDAKSIVDAKIELWPKDDELKNNSEYFDAYYLILKISYLKRNNNLFINFKKEILRLFPDCINPENTEQIKEWESELGIENGPNSIVKEIESTHENDPSLVNDDSSIWTPPPEKESSHQETGTQTIVPSSISNVENNTNTTTSGGDDIDLKAIEIPIRLQWTPPNKSIPEIEIKKTFGKENINLRLLWQLKGRWFTIVENNTTGSIELHVSREWSSLDYIENKTLTSVQYPGIYVIDKRVRMAEFHAEDGKNHIKLTLPRDEIQIIQINGAMIVSKR